MGLFTVRGRLVGPEGHSEEVELLVDTAATLLTVPKDLADRLGVVPTRQQPVVTAGGREVWPVGEVRLELDGQQVTTPCFLRACPENPSGTRDRGPRKSRSDFRGGLAPGGPVLLGAVALESLFLAVDPVAKKLVPVEGFVGRARNVLGGVLWA